MRTRKDPEERKREIFAAAERLFAANGYVATTVADIARAAGVAKVTFFYYFETKDALLEAIGRHWAQELRRRYDAMEKGGSAVERLRAFLHLLEGDDPLELVIDRLVAEHQYRLMETIWQTMRAETMDPLLVGILAQGAADGSMKLAGDVDSVIHFLWYVFDAMFPTENGAAPGDEAKQAQYLAIGHRLMETMLGLEEGALKL